MRPVGMAVGVRLQHQVTIRKCPFCAEPVHDEPGRTINYAMHMGRWTEAHMKKREWADYIERLNFRAF